MATRSWRSGVLTIVAGLLVVEPPASARIFKTKPSASSNWTSGLPITIGSGFEFETDKEQSQYDFPFLFEYNFTEQLKLTLEPNVTYIESKSQDVRTTSGLGDFETSLEYEFLRERRYRPALAALGLIKWPTATDPDIGSPGRDYSLGLVVSKDFAYFDLDMNVLYTWVGDPEQTNTLELSLAGEYPLNHFLSVEAEVVRTIGSGGVRGQPGTLTGLGGAGASADQTEGTFGLAQRINRFLKLEEGIIVRSDLSTQIVFAWEYSFSGEN